MMAVSITETVMKRVVSPLRISSGPKYIAMPRKYAVRTAGSQMDFFMGFRFCIVFGVQWFSGSGASLR